MFTRNRLAGLSAATLLVMPWAAPLACAETVKTTLTKLGDLPRSGSDPTVTSPQSPRGTILQMGDELWFTTFSGGENSVGAIVSYDLGDHVFKTEYSFGLLNPTDPSTARYDGYNPWKTALYQNSVNGNVYYAASFGGASWTGTNNGGAIGVFNPNTVTTSGVSVLWSGGTTSSNPNEGTSGDPRSLQYTTPIFLPDSSGTGSGSLYFNTYNGTTPGNTTADNGTIQKLTLDATGHVTAVKQVTTFIGAATDPNPGRQPQGSLLLANGKLFITTPSAASGALPTLQMIDPATDAVTILSKNWTNGGNNGAWNTPVYDSKRNSIYSVTLNGGVLKFDLSSGLQSLYATADTSTGNFASPVLFGDSLYYIKQSTGSGASLTGGQIWRFDLSLNTSELLYNLASFGGNATVSSGSLMVGQVNGQAAIFFTTAADTVGDNFGALYQLQITSVPEPGSLALLVLGAGVAGIRRRRVRSTSTQHSLTS